MSHIGINGLCGSFDFCDGRCQQGRHCPLTQKKIHDQIRASVERAKKFNLQQLSSQKGRGMSFEYLSGLIFFILIVVAAIYVTFIELMR